jgi:uncharacterized protein
LDLTPLIPGGRQIIESYGEGRFRVSGQAYAGNHLVFPERVLPWSAMTATEASLENLAAVIESARAGRVDLLLLGQGSRMQPVSLTLRQALRQAGIVVEPMDTGAACRTYNVLMAEGRLVAAALIAVA